MFSVAYKFVSLTARSHIMLQSFLFFVSFQRVPFVEYRVAACNRAQSGGVGSGVDLGC